MLFDQSTHLSMLSLESFMTFHCYFKYSITLTLLSLVVIQVVYTLMDDLSGWFGKWLIPHGKEHSTADK